MEGFPRVQELAGRYGFPAISTKSPFWIAILELDGGWSADDLAQYCEQQGIPVPPIKEITTPGGKDGTITGKGADGEYALDMQVLL